MGEEKAGVQGQKNQCQDLTELEEGMVVSTSTRDPYINMEDVEEEAERPENDQFTIIGDSTIGSDTIGA